MVVLAVQREGGHGLDGTLLCDLAQRVDVHLCSAISDGSSCLTKQKGCDLDKLHVLVFEGQRVDDGRHFLAGAAPAGGEVDADQALIVDKHLCNELERRKGILFAVIVHALQADQLTASSNSSIDAGTAANGSEQTHKPRHINQIQRCG